ncbi:MAG: hypothetical protein D6694_01870 [Gammaproteobacteria bacterium]|nr:MAG: hypothetical protein D6694_01870 [Gammaproteobacteria bacterium]
MDLEHENHTQVEETPSGRRCIVLSMNQLCWSNEINKAFPLELLTWLISDSLSPAAITFAANARIHVIRKPQSRKGKDSYLVSGGFLYYLILLKAGWTKEVECILDQTGVAKNIPAHFYADTCLTVFSQKFGPAATGVRAAVFTRLLDLGESTAAPCCFKLLSRHFRKGGNLLREFVGFSSRGFKGLDVQRMPKEIRRQVIEIIGLKPIDDDKEMAITETDLEQDDNEG